MSQLTTVEIFVEVQFRDPFYKSNPLFQKEVAIHCIKKKQGYIYIFDIVKYKQLCKQFCLIDEKHVCILSIEYKTEIAKQPDLSLESFFKRIKSSVNSSNKELYEIGGLNTGYYEDSISQQCYVDVWSHNEHWMDYRISLIGKDEDEIVLLSFYFHPSFIVHYHYSDCMEEIKDQQEIFNLCESRVRYWGILVPELSIFEE